MLVTGPSFSLVSSGALHPAAILDITPGPSDLPAHDQSLL